jgi:nucleoside-diphosphate kinase
MFSHSFLSECCKDKDFLVAASCVLAMFFLKKVLSEMVSISIFCWKFSEFYFVGNQNLWYLCPRCAALLWGAKAHRMSGALMDDNLFTLNKIFMAIEKTLVLLKPCTLQRGLVGEITGLFEKKGLRICGMKMMWLTDELLSEHYAHLSEKPFFQRVKDAMMTAPVIALCLEGVDAIAAVRAFAGPTNGRLAAPGTIRGSYCMSFQENIVHASDSAETAEVELKRFFRPEEIFEWKQAYFDFLYANDEF